MTEKDFSLRNTFVQQNGVNNKLILNKGGQKDIDDFINRALLLFFYVVKLKGVSRYTK